MHCFHVIQTLFYHLQVKFTFVTSDHPSLCCERLAEMPIVDETVRQPGCGPSHLSYTKGSLPNHVYLFLKVASVGRTRHQEVSAEVDSVVVAVVRLTRTVLANLAVVTAGIAKRQVEEALVVASVSQAVTIGTKDKVTQDDPAEALEVASAEAVVAAAAEVCTVQG